MDFDQILSQYRVVHINIRGLNSNKQNLEHYLGEHNYPEIVTLNETMMNKKKGAYWVEWETRQYDPSERYYTRCG